MALIWYGARLLRHVSITRQTRAPGTTSLLLWRMLTKLAPPTSSSGTCWAKPLAQTNADQPGTTNRLLPSWFRPGTTNIWHTPLAR
eukprot:1319452-Lingulodinium_polyedra.AAC.1